MRLRRRSVYARERHRQVQRLAVRLVVPKRQWISEQSLYTFQAIRTALKLAGAPTSHRCAAGGDEWTETPLIFTRGHTTVATAQPARIVAAFGMGPD